MGWDRVGDHPPSPIWLMVGTDTRMLSYFFSVQTLSDSGRMRTCEYFHLWKAENAKQWPTHSQPKPTILTPHFGAPSLTDKMTNLAIIVYMKLWFKIIYATPNRFGAIFVWIHIYMCIHIQFRIWKCLRSA